MSDAKTPKCDCHEKCPTWPVFRENQHVDGCPYREIELLRAQVADLEGAIRSHRTEAASQIRDIARRIGPAATNEWIREQLDRLASQLEFWAK